jgi:hypothetical protein
MSFHIQFWYGCIFEKKEILKHLLSILSDFQPREIAIAAINDTTTVFVSLSKPLDLRCFTQKKFTYCDARPKFWKHIRGSTAYDKQFKPSKTEVLKWSPETDNLVSLRETVNTQSNQIEELEKQLRHKNLELAELRSFKEKVEALKIIKEGAKNKLITLNIMEEIRRLPHHQAGKQAILDISKLSSEILWKMRKL